MLEITPWAYSIVLLHIALALKCDYKYENIEKVLFECQNMSKSSYSLEKLSFFKEVFCTFGPKFFKIAYQKYKTINLIYYIDDEILDEHGIGLTLNIIKREKVKKWHIQDINSNFYDGFEISI